MEPIDLQAQWMVAALIHKYYQRDSYWANHSFVDWLKSNLGAFADSGYFVTGEDDPDEQIACIARVLFGEKNA